MIESNGAKSLMFKQAGLLACVFTGLFFAYPAVYASTFSSFYGSIKSAFGWSNLYVGAGTSAATLGMAIGSMLLSRYSRTSNLRSYMRIGYVGFAASLCLLSVAPASLPLYVTISLMIGVFGAFTSVGTFMTLLPLWFERNLGKSIAIAMMGMSLGIILIPLAAQGLIETIAWRNAYVVLALATLSAGLLVTYLLPIDRGPVETSPGLIAGTAGGLAADEVRTLWVLGPCFFMVSLGGFGIAAHAVPLYASLAEATSKSSVIVALGMGTLIGRVGLGFLIDRFFAPYAGAAVFVTGSLASITLAADLGHSGGLLALLPILCFGLCFGAEWDLMAYLTRRYFAPAKYSAIYNRLLTINYIGGICGPVLISFAVDFTGAYRMPLAIFAGLYLLAALLLLVVGPYRYRVAAGQGAH